MNQFTEEQKNALKEFEAMPINIDKALYKSLALPEHKAAYKDIGVDAFEQPKETGEGDKQLKFIQDLSTLAGRSLSLIEGLRAVTAFKQGKIIITFQDDKFSFN